MAENSRGQTSRIRGNDSEMETDRDHSGPRQNTSSNREMDSDRTMNRGRERTTRNDRYMDLDIYERDSE